MNSSKLVLFGKDIWNTLERISQCRSYKRRWLILFIDTKQVNLLMDKNYFNPSKSNKIMYRNPEFYLGRLIGGFNWELKLMNQL